MSSVSNTPLLISVSGLRGIVGGSLTPQLAVEFAAAYGTAVGPGRIVVSRDGRSSGVMIKEAVAAGLMAVGCTVVDVGVATTPTCGYFIQHTKAKGGVQITASHNPPEWNGLKLFRPEGFVLSPAAGKDVADRYQKRQWSFVGAEKVGEYRTAPDPAEAHLDGVLSIVDIPEIRARGYRVVFDANHGSGSRIGPRLLEALGCKVTVLGGEPDGRFEHPPEPTEANLSGFAEQVRRIGADVGFAVDPDADRLAIVDGSGRYIGEEYTLALAIRQRTRQKRGPVVLNSSTSRVSEDAAKAAGCSVERTKVGEVHVAERMRAVGAVLGGEGNGGVIDPRVGFGRDSAAGMALVLELMAQERRSIAELVADLPAYAIQKDKFIIQPEKLSSILAAVKREFREGTVDDSDGVRVDWPDAWVQVRASNTEPILRVIAEAKESLRAASLCAAVGKIVQD